MTYHGKIVAVTSRPVGAEVVEDSSGPVVRVVDASVFDVSGGVLTVEGVAVPYVSADPDGVDGDTVTLANSLSVLAGDRLNVSPVRLQVWATVRLWDDGEPVPALVPLALRNRLVEGVREDASTAETVLVDFDAGSSPVVVDVVGDEGAFRFGAGEQTRLGSGRDRLSVNNNAGQVVGGVTADGELVGQSGAVAGDLSVGGVPLMGRLWDNSPGAPAGWLERFAAGDVASAFFNDEKPQRATAEEWGYAKVAFTARAGRSYSITATVGAFPGVAGGSIRTRLRYVTGGGEPSIASPLIGGTTDNTGAAAHGANLMTAASRGRLSFETDTQVKVMVSTEGLSGATPTVTRAYFEVQDLGPQGAYGGGTYTTGREAVPPPTVREYTSTWTATGFRVFDADGQPVNASEPRQWGPAGAALIAAYPFTEGTGATAADTSNNGHHITDVQGWDTEGHTGPALGVRSGLTTLPFDPPTGQWAVTAWIKWDGTTGWHSIIENSPGYYIEVNGDTGTVVAWINNHGMESTEPLTPNVWTHVAVTSTRPGGALYFNGQLAATAPSEAQMPWPTGTTYVGSGTANPGRGMSIDDLRVYGSNLSGSDVQAIMTAGGVAAERDHTALAFDGAAVQGADTGHTVTDALAGANLTKAEVFLANTSWGGSDDGVIALGKGGFASLPLTLPNPQSTVHPRVPTGAGVWVTVPTSWFSDTNRVVTLGDADGGVMGGWFQGPQDALPPQIRLTYTR